MEQRQENNWEGHSPAVRGNRSYSRGRGRGRGRYAGGQASYVEKQDENPIFIDLSEKKTLEINYFKQKVYCHFWDLPKNKNVALNSQEVLELKKRFQELEDAVDYKLAEVQETEF